ncbi:hypothetical protein GCM10010289_75850 [Streptomyces violascens]|uniref:Uncharacterized protein n=1 Tax=Streptomyces violascens TaxID=67381 RepID=A0ABQ3QV46_9ACTN|nr:hypothetical protein GCM10010289_75850 [Streptomyces violascens]GHI41152.1 hypothetical protein Sviol_55600 [Streptomyces violascens]
MDAEPLHEVRVERVRDGVLEGLDSLFGGRRAQPGEGIGALVLPKPTLDTGPSLYDIAHDGHGTGAPQRATDATG